MNIFSKKKSGINRGFYLYLTFIIIACTVLSLYYFIDAEFLNWFADEDHFSETLSALFLFLAGAIFIINSFYRIKKGSRFRHESLFMLFGLMLFVAFWEEIEWGQRIFHVATPEFFMKYNVKQELSIHNLKIFHSKFFNPNTIIDVFVYIIGIMIPVICLRSKKFRRALEKINFPIIPFSFLPIFTVGLVFGLAMAHLTDHKLYAPNEIKEFIYSIGFLLYSIAVVSWNKTRRKLGTNNNILEKN